MAATSFAVAPFPIVSDAERHEPSRARQWAGRALQAPAVLFLMFDATMKLLQLVPAVEATAQLGFPAGALLPIGLLQAALLVLYLVPRTRILGAVLWTGYLGGAVAIHVRMGNPVLTHILMPIYVAIFLWGGLWLIDRRLRQVFSRV